MLDIIKEEDFGSHVLEAFNENIHVDKFNYAALDWCDEVKFIHKEYDYAQGVECYYVDAPKSESDWRPLLGHALEILASKSSHAIFIAPEADLYHNIVTLVPWGIKSVQVAYQPKAKRVRAEFGNDIHRCSAVLLENDTVVIETEFMNDCVAPRERFVYPAKVAIFIMGIAPG